tara:strand:- start:160 stop:285 length:126 start_codon:yes stop_codon:yes gene_type:complete
MGLFSKLLDFIEALLIMFFKLAMVVIICGTILALGINLYGN